MDMVGKNIKLSKLSISLLKKFDKRPEVQVFMLKKWYEFDDFENRMELMWRILDGDDLDDKINQDIYSYIIKNEGKFINKCKQWYGEKVLLKACKSRLSDNSISRKKDWIYLYAAIGASEKEEVLTLISSYINSEDDFVREVANYLIATKF